MTELAVEARDLVLAYGRLVAVDRSDFAIPVGTVTAVIGPNGSGKSTLLNAIAGVMVASGGRLDVAARRAGPERVAYVLQAAKVNESLPVTVREVVAMGRYAGRGAYERLNRADRSAMAEAMERTGIADLAGRHLPELSGGQRQRVFVAQGLAQEHDLLLLDEPLTGVDLVSAQAIDDVIHDEVGRGCTVVMTTHDLSEARAADHVLLLAGRVVGSGPPAEVLGSANLVDAYGPAMLHLEEGHMVVDDPAHIAVPGRHVHRDRSIHTEVSRTDLHGDG